MGMRGRQPDIRHMCQMGTRDSGISTDPLRKFSLQTSGSGGLGSEATPISRIHALAMRPPSGEGLGCNEKSSNPTDASAHQTVTEFIRLETADETIQIGFTDQRISGRAGLLTFAGFLQWYRFDDLLAGAIPAFKKRKRGFEPFEFALTFVIGILACARKLTHLPHLRSDVILARFIAVTGIPSQSALNRFFQRFNSSAANLSTFRPLWRWGLERWSSRPGGYALDLNSTRLLHEDGHQEGVAVGYTRLGTKPCLHPLIAVLEEAKLVAGFWLRPDNTSCANNVAAFMAERLSYLPSFIHLRVVRADSGFCVPEWLGMLEERRLR
jgi:Transposase DDE domain group 1